MPAPAPYRDDLAKGADTRAFWLHSADGVRLRAGHAAPSGRSTGTVFILPGRTEYLEKYGQTAADFVTAGFDVLSVDWRGQGLSDRCGAAPRVGHVARFQEFQKDWSSLCTYARTAGLPKPWHMLAHSMGGCIGLRALMQGSDMASVMFSAPMWGIEMPALMRPVAWLLPRLAMALGQGHRLALGTSIESYVLKTAFKDNRLTTDPEIYAFLQRHVMAEPAFQLGGPSYAWLASGLQECAALAALPSPALPALCFVGSNEQIVDTGAIRQRMAGWPGGKMLLVDGAEHEVLMERPSTRRQVTGAAISLFSNVTA